MPSLDPLLTKPETKPSLEFESHQFTKAWESSWAFGIFSLLKNKLKPTYIQSDQQVKKTKHSSEEYNWILNLYNIIYNVWNIMKISQAKKHENVTHSQRKMINRIRPWDCFSSVQFSHSVMSDSLRPHELQHARPPCPSPTPGVHSNSCPSSRWCHPAISSSVVPFSSWPQSLPASESFPMSQLFAWGGQSIGVSASATVLPKNTQDWSPL